MLQEINRGMRIRHQSGKLFFVSDVSVKMVMDSAASRVISVDVTVIDTSSPDYEETTVTAEEFRRMLLAGEGEVVK